MITRFDAIHERDGQTDRQTPHDGIGRASHWHDKRFTLWHAIWPANDGITSDSVRRDAWQCGSGEVVRAMSDLTPPTLDT